MHIPLYPLSGLMRAQCPRSFMTKTSQSKSGFSHRKHRQRSIRARSQDTTANEIFEEAKAIFEQGDRMKALRIYERALKQDISQNERREALYGATVVHASFGDIEQAQMTLREALDAGLDFEAALSDKSLLKWRSGPQVLAQLKKFARTVKSIREAVKPAPSKRSLDSISLSGEESGRPNANMDLSEMLRTDITGLDATVTGIVRRVALLIIVGLLLGTILFYVGLEFSGISR